MKKLKIYYICCKKELPFKFATQLYCGSCSVHHREVSKKITYLNVRIRKLEEKIKK
jgi:hypothetical protein